ncbi:class I SAM-dependent methyltransferase [Chryseobacterium nematophagum]|uniref:Class I SAM-dependent methyltransferase n=1 Tax=Chryseobacterium nematophagum TaxID=2305228 RepID=A0A3M7TGT1_9FLAO|nr:class I SAM-dependent methyltransferase [Chryseobacterium nematophagum]RNA61839.1 class I SAM-dependent methyltransferase [Chryseobacterium nematophagum]
MYSIAKNIIRKILPQKFLFENEMLFRKLLYPLYKGSHYECNICHSKLKNFITLENGNLLCPICGSLPRSRRLYKILNDEYLKDKVKFLDFSPSRSIFRKLKKRKNIQYFSTDYEDEFLADYHFDITQIDTESETFDLIVCYHILEHIERDHLAMSELYRVLKTDGSLLIQTPFKDGHTYEDSTIKTPEERLKHFGQEDHVRVYSVENLVERLEKAGFITQVKTFTKDSYHGFAENERVIICKKEAF